MDTAKLILFSIWVLSASFMRGPLGGAPCPSQIQGTTKGSPSQVCKKKQKQKQKQNLATAQGVGQFQALLGGHRVGALFGRQGSHCHLSTQSQTATGH